MKIRKLFKKAAALATTILTGAVLNTNAYAAAGGPPAGVETATFNGLVTVIMWVVRVIITAFAVPCIIKIVQGHSNEDPRERNNGVIGCVVVGAVFGASFAIQALLQG